MPETNLLSEREEEILQLVAKGLTNREIAQMLIISQNTVKVHLRNIFEKLGVSSRTEATMFGIEHGIVDVPGVEEGKAETASVDIDRSYRWVFVTIISLVIALLAFFGSRTLFPNLSPTFVTTADVSERWQELTPMPEVLENMAAVAYDGNIYAIAGEGSEGVSGRVFRYITSKDRWERLSEKPIPVVDVEGTLLGEKIYIPGGQLANGRLTDVLEIYDPRQDLWEVGASLPIPISAYAMTDFEGRLYLFGGWDGDKALDIVLCYDPQENRWEELTSMPTARAYAGAAEAGGKIYVMGGWDGEQALDINESYNPSRDRQQEQAWQQEIRLPHAEEQLEVESMAGMLFVVDSAGILQLNISENTWTQNSINTNIFGNKSFSAMITPGGFIYIMAIPDDNFASTTAIYRFRILYTITIPNVTN